MTAAGGGFWKADASSGAGAVVAYSALATNTVTVNPVVKALVDSMTVTLPAATDPRTAIVSAVAQHSGGTPRRFMIYLDGVKVWPNSTNGAESQRMSDIAGDGMRWTVAGVVVPIPADSNTHQIQMWWEAHTNTNSTNLLLRSLAVLTY